MPISSNKDLKADEAIFYDDWHRSQHDLYSRYPRLKRLKGKLASNRFLRGLTGHLFYFSFRREVFFRNVLDRHCDESKKPIILDLACGAGHRVLSEYGYVVGIDISGRALEMAQAVYDRVVQADVLEALPFKDATFDVILSCDFLGHIEADKKDKLLSEIYRVLKKGGITAHVMETDSENIVFKFAKNYPALFTDYFVKQFGHVGLELPSKALKRFQAHNFSVTYCEKIFGALFESSAYVSLFDNDFRKKSRTLSLWVRVCKVLSRSLLTRLAIDYLLGILSVLEMKLTSLEKASGLLVILRR